MKRHTERERAAIASRVAVRFGGERAAVRVRLVFVGRRLVRRPPMTATQRADIRRTVRGVARLEAAILDVVGNEEEVTRRRAEFGRQYAGLIRQCRRFGSFGAAAFSAGEAARHLTTAGDTRRKYGADEWGRSSTRDSLEWARRWNEHAAGRLPR